MGAFNLTIKNMIELKIVLYFKFQDLDFIGSYQKVKIFYDDDEVAEFPSERYDGFEQSKIWIHGFKVGKDSDIDIQIEKRNLDI